MTDDERFKKWSEDIWTIHDHITTADLSRRIHNEVGAIIRNNPRLWRSNNSFYGWMASIYEDSVLMAIRRQLDINNLNVAGKSCPVPKHTEKQQIPRSHGFRDPEVVRVGRTHLPVAYPRSDLTSLRYPSPPRLRITGRLTPV